MRRPDNLSDLLGPVGLSEFSEDHLEKWPLFVRRAQSVCDCKSLFSLDDVDRVLSSSDLRVPSFRAVNRGTLHDPKTYTRTIRFGDRIEEGLIDSNTVIDMVQEGSTLIVQALEQHNEPIATLCEGIYSQLPILVDVVQANAYLTPPKSAGFAAHFDTHDVFVVQTHGEKLWEIWPTPIELPRRSQKGTLTSADVELYTKTVAPIARAKLTPGDVLYVPRGFVHRAKSEFETSLHVTIGIIAVSPSDLAREIVARCIKQVKCEFALSKSVSAIRDNSENQQILDDSTSSIRETYNIDDAFERILAGRNGLLRFGGSGQISNLFKFQLQNEKATKAMFNPDVSCYHLMSNKGGEGTVSLRHRGITVDVSAALASAYRAGVPFEINSFDSNQINCLLDAGFIEYVLDV